MTSNNLTEHYHSSCLFDLKFISIVDHEIRQSCRGIVRVRAMVKLLKQILTEEDQDLKRLTLVLLLLTLGTITTQYLAHRMLPGAGVSHFTVRAAP